MSSESEKVDALGDFEVEGMIFEVVVGISVVAVVVVVAACVVVVNLVV